MFCKRTKCRLCDLGGEGCWEKSPVGSRDLRSSSTFSRSVIQALCFTVWRRGVCGPFYAHSPTWRRGVCGPSWSTSCATFLFYVPPREGRWFFSWQGEVDVMPRAARMFMSKYLLGRPRSGRSLFSRARRRLRVEHTLSTGEACRKSYPFACFAMRAISLCFAIML